jgi:hypothetical protein
VNHTEAPAATTPAEARELIDLAPAILRQHIGPDGVGTPGAVDPTEVARAADFFKTVGCTRQIPWTDSYRAKHDIERHFAPAGVYVSNGAAITAAVGLGIRWRPIPLRDKKNVELRLRRVRRRAGKGAS